MSQLDLIAELRAHRPVAPAELRERVRQLAADAPAPRRRFTWRRALVVAIAVGRAGGGRPACSARATAGTNAARRRDAVETQKVLAAPTAARQGGDSSAGSAPQIGAAPRTRRPGPAPPSSSQRSRRRARTNAQRYSATLSLRLQGRGRGLGRDEQGAADRRRDGRPPDRPCNVDAARKDGEAYLVLQGAAHPRPGGGRRSSARSARSSARTSRSRICRRASTRPRRTIARLQAQLAELRAPAADRGRARADRHALGAHREPPAPARRHDPRRVLRDREAAHARRRRPPPPARRTATARCTGSASRSAGSGSARSTRSRSARRSCCCSLLALAPRARHPPPARGALLAPQPGAWTCGEDAERRRPDRQLAELGVDAAGVLRARRVGLLDLGLAHRQRLAHRADRAEAGLPPLGRAEHVEVDLDVVDLLHAADVGVPPALVRVDEGAAPREAGARVDDLVAVHLAAAALHLVLRVQGERRARLCSCCMARIVCRVSGPRKT